MADDSALRAYKLTLMGSGISIDREIDEAIALAIVQVLMGGPPLALPAVPRSVGGSLLAGSGQRLSLREVLEESGARTIPAKIVTISQFLRDHEGQAAFTRDDNKARFRTAGEPAPANYPRDFAKAVKAGWIAEDHQNSGQFYVTRRGDEAISSRFESDAPAPRARRRRARIENGDQT